MSESLFSVREIERVREVDWEIEGLLMHNTPQALLRDLHRPVKTFRVSPLEFRRVDAPLSDAGRKTSAEVKETIRADYRVDIVGVAPTRTLYQEAMAELHAILGSPWADAPRYGRQYLPASMIY